MKKLIVNNNAITHTKIMIVIIIWQQSINIVIVMDGFALGLPNMYQDCMNDLMVSSPSVVVLF